MRHKINPHLKNKLKQPQPPPVDSWEYIQANLPRKKKKSRFLFGTKQLG